MPLYIGAPFGRATRRNYSGCLCHHCLENITTEPHPVSVRELANFLLDLSRTLMGAGAHTSRVVRNVTRIAESFGYKVDMTIFQMHITMTIRYAGDDTIRRTSVGKIGPAAFNFDIISQISSLSWEAHDEHLSFRELTEKYGNHAFQGGGYSCWSRRRMPVSAASSAGMSLQWDSSQRPLSSVFSYVRR